MLAPVVVVKVQLLPEEWIFFGLRALLTLLLLEIQAAEVVALQLLNLLLD
jgi:hypothetical protein